MLLCGEFNARTAEEPDFLRMAELHPFLSTALDEGELPDHILCNTAEMQSGPACLRIPDIGFCQQADLLILNVIDWILSAAGPLGTSMGHSLFLESQRLLQHH